MLISLLALLACNPTPEVPPPLAILPARRLKVQRKDQAMESERQRITEKAGTEAGTRGEAVEAENHNHR